MRELSDETRRLIERMFPSGVAEVAALIEDTCNDNLPLLGKPTPENTNLERIRYSVLKLSGETMEGLRRAIAIATRDWRDVLVFAGFGNSITEHRRWAAEVLDKAER